MAKRNFDPTLESLEGRLALSGGMTAAVIKPHHVALKGELSGTFSLKQVNPDVGKSQTLTGAGTVSPLGDLKVSGTLTSPGFVAHGRATGLLTLSNAHGSMIIQLTGPSQPGFSTLPRHFSFKIVQATGQFLGDTDTGIATLSEFQAVTDPPPPQSGLPIVVGPIFTLSLRSS